MTERGTERGLDAAFLEFIRAPDPQARRRIHGWYVRLFEGCGKVVDLACGGGEFVGFLSETGIEAIGVDDDPANVAKAAEAGHQVFQSDVIDWLEGQPPESIDGVFNAHLVEHLPYETVAALYRECHRVLSPGGRMVTVTPNVRAIYSHLETFYQHFGHVSFYHPLLLRFFGERAGFERSEEGENPQLASPMFGHTDSSRLVGTKDSASGAIDAGPAGPAPHQAGLTPVLRYDPELPRRRGLLGSLWWRAKMTAVRFLVQPFLDPLVDDIRAALTSTDVELRRLDKEVRGTTRVAARLAAELEDIVVRLDRPYEAYVISTKAGRLARAGDQALRGGARGGTRDPR